MNALATVPRETDDVPAADRIHALPIEFVTVGPNVRVNVAGLDELAASIAEQGVLQPIKVRHAEDGAGYVVVWGQRRLLAAGKAGLTEIPAFIDDAERSPEQLSIEQLVENLHRADLNPIDRAQAMRAVVNSGITQADLARKLGIAPSTVANDVGLLEAPAGVLALVEQGELTAAHAKAMKGLAPKTQLEMARNAAKSGWSAHETERYVQDAKRRADAEAEQRAARAKESEAHRAQFEASIAEFEKKKVGKADQIVVDTSYSSEGGHLVDLIKKAGYENTRLAKTWNEIEARPSGGLCDCAAWKARQNVTYGRWDSKLGQSETTYRISITKGCIVRSHRQAKEAVADAKRHEKEALARAVQQRVRETSFGAAIPSTSADTPLLIAIPRILAEAALWDVLSYRLPEWSVAQGGKREKAWATIHGLSDEKLATTLAMELASDFRDKAGYHVDWPGLAAELGLEAETPA